LIENPPGWLEFRRPKHLPDERIGELGRGERDAILLAEELHVALVVDEAKAYHEARRRNVPVLRTLAVLDKAAERGLIDLAEAIIIAGRSLRSRKCSAARRIACSKSPCSKSRKLPFLLGLPSRCVRQCGECPEIESRQWIQRSSQML